MTPQDIKTKIEIIVNAIRIQEMKLNVVKERWDNTESSNRIINKIEEEKQKLEELKNKYPEYFI